MDGAILYSTYSAGLILSACAVVRDRRGGERRRASLAAFVWTGTSALRGGGLLAASGVVLLALDLALVLFLVGLAWKARRGWPVAAALVQCLGAAALLASLIDGRISGGDLNLDVSAGATHLTAAVLVVGAWFQRVPGGVLAPRTLAASTMAALSRSGVSRLASPKPQTGPGHA